MYVSKLPLKMYVILFLILYSNSIKELALGKCGVRTKGLPNFVNFYSFETINQISNGKANEIRHVLQNMARTTLNLAT